MTLISVEDKNNNTYPVTFLDWASPLSQDVMNQAYFTMKAKGMEKPTYEAYEKPYYGYLPDESDITLNRVLIEMKPGESKKQKVLIRDPESLAMPKLDAGISSWVHNLGDEVSIQMKGRWYRVWAKPKEDVIREMREKEGIDFASGAYGGHFESNWIEIKPLEGDDPGPFLDFLLNVLRVIDKMAYRWYREWIPAVSMFDKLRTEPMYSKEWRAFFVKSPS